MGQLPDSSTLGSTGQFAAGREVFHGPDVFPGRAALQQRVLPAYRAPLFDTLARQCEGGLAVFAGQPLPQESILVTERLQEARFTRAENRHLFHPGSPFYQCWQPGLLDWLKRWQPQVLVVEANPRYRSTPAAVRWMHARGRKVLGWGLGAPALHGPLARLRSTARRRFLCSFDALIAYSRRGADEYRQQGFPVERIFVAPNAAAPRPAGPPPQRPLVFDGSPRILFVGRLQARKRLDNLLRACAALPDSLRPELWIVGDGPARSEFEACAAQVFPTAQFLGDRRGPDLQALFSRADLFVLPGTGGLAVQQAMSYALPVIVAQGDGTQDDLVRSQAANPSGWLVPPDNEAALRNALQVALQDPARLRQMGAAAFRLVDEEINLETMAQAFIRAMRAVQD